MESIRLSAEDLAQTQSEFQKSLQTITGASETDESKQALEESNKEWLQTLKDRKQ